MGVVTHEEIMNSLPPERRKRIEAMVEAKIDEMGLRDLANQLRGQSSKDVVHRVANEPFHATMNDYLADKVMQVVR